MTDQEKMDGLAKWILLEHAKVHRAEGYKGSCHYVSFQKEYERHFDEEADERYDAFPPEDYDPYLTTRLRAKATWTCRFGGYCFGGLSRTEEEESWSLDDLIAKVRKKILDAIEEGKKEE